ncbi:hypothetical protein [Prosthecomicrobium pneumaticum]|uniref:DUF4864 domain-containing protein n=1 Tax=Prosthecomicrobium pneumaticum TaxID=81895 RepID=A0A7W9CUC7_9HYPH|nr:hypothetical protein [Prosthecomicrobium pneumaticum]MBB5751713.1 hypothetical protein [Prosthecomicrobium pneumaticum]
MQRLILVLMAWLAVSAGQAAAQGAAPPPPSLPAALALVRSTLIAVDQANLTDDYSVLRMLGTPAFVQSNSADFLSQAFRPWRQPGRDFGFVAVAEPRLQSAPAIDERGILRLVGRVPTPNFDLAFDLAYQFVEGRWRVAGILIRPERPQVDAFSLDSLGEVAPPAPRTAEAAPADTPPLPRRHGEASLLARAPGGAIPEDASAAADGAPINAPSRRAEAIPPLPPPRP